MQSAPGALAAFRLVPHVGTELDARAVDRLRNDAVERQAPRIVIEHQIGENPPVVRADSPPAISCTVRHIEGTLPFLDQGELQARVAEELVLVAPTVYDLG